jgi:hypothetical protein
MIHIDEEPELRSGRLHTVIAKEFDSDSVEWLKEVKKVTEAWIYDSAVGRVMAWYEIAS